MTETLTEQIYYTLSNGVKIPAVGFGLHRMPEGEVTVNSVKCAIESGYRHIDTAWAYHNQIGVGKAIKECIEEGIVKREDLFITSKLYMHRMSYEETLDNFQESLEQLGLDYLDLYLIHDVDRTDTDWKIKNIDSWRAMEKLYKEGKVRAIGVSNYGIEHLEFLLSKAEIKPMVNQVETHPQHQQIRLAGFCRGQNILIESWAPLFEGKILKNPVVQDIAQRLGKTPAQIAIRWNLQKGFSPLIGSKNTEHIKQNFEVFGWEIPESDMNLLEKEDNGEFTNRSCDGILPRLMVPLDSTSGGEYKPLSFEKTFKLFGLIPFLKEKKSTWYKTKWYFFGIPILKIHTKDWKDPKVEERNKK